MLHTCTSCCGVHPQLSSQPVLRKVRSLFSGVLLEHFINKSSSAPDHRVTVLTCSLQRWPCPAEILAAPAERLRSSRPNLCSRGTHHLVVHGVTSPGIPLSFSGMISNKPRREFGRSTSPPESEESELISDHLFQATQTHYYRDDRKKPWKNTCRRGWLRDAPSRDRIHQNSMPSPRGSLLHSDTLNVSHDMQHSPVHFKQVNAFRQQRQRQRPRPPEPLQNLSREGSTNGTRCEQTLTSKVRNSGRTSTGSRLSEGLTFRKIHSIL